MRTNVAIIFVLTAVVSTYSLADQTTTPVDIEHLGEPLSLKKLGAKEQSILKKLEIQEVPLGNGLTPTPRVIAIAGGGRSVLVFYCDASAHEDSCNLTTIVSLDTGKQFSIPEDLFPTRYSDPTGSSSSTAFVINEKGELQSIVYASNAITTFKGKRTCDNKGAIADVDGKNARLTVRFRRKTLGKDCMKLDSSDYDAFYRKLFAKTLGS